MLNIFSNLKKYAGNWEEVASRKFNEDEIKCVDKAIVMQSDVSLKEGYGLSVCFYFKNGERSYIPLSRDSQLSLGETVDLTKVDVVTIERDNEQKLRIR